jgi:hypothetical protein
VRGYEVVASDERQMGRVVDVKHGYLVVESGWLRKVRRPVPHEFVHVVDEAAKAFVTVPRRVLRDAPHVDRRGNFDLREAARHYGLTAAHAQSPTQRLGEPLPRDPAYGADHESSSFGREPPEHRRAEIHKHMQPGVAGQHNYGTPALFGDRRAEAPLVRRG